MRLRQQRSPSTGWLAQSPLQELPQRHDELALEEGQQLVAYCHHGVRSYNAAAFLEHVGHGEVYSLAGGIAAWSREVDPKVPTY